MHQLVWTCEKHKSCPTKARGQSNHFQCIKQAQPVVKSNDFKDLIENILESRTVKRTSIQMSYLKLKGKIGSLSAFLDLYHRPL